MSYREGLRMMGMRAPWGGVMKAKYEQITRTNILYLRVSVMNRTPRGRRGWTPPVTLPLFPVGSGAGTSVSWESKRKQLIAISGARDLSASPNLILFPSFTPVIRRRCSSYYTTVNVGGQPFNVALDTGSADLVTWAPAFHPKVNSSEQFLVDSDTELRCNRVPLFKFWCCSIHTVPNTS
jgi:hypothetical protein